MQESAIIKTLRRRRALLLKTWLLHVGCFTSTCAFAATNSAHVTVASLWFVLVTIPPVLLYTVLVDRSCRKIDPNATSVGLAKIVVITVLFTPIESSLVLPIKNLLVARRILETCKDHPPDHSGGPP